MFADVGQLQTMMPIIFFFFCLCKKFHNQNLTENHGFRLRPWASQSYCQICILYFIFHPWPSRIKTKLLFSFKVLNWNQPWRRRSHPQEVAPCIQTEDWSFNNFSFTLTLNLFDGSEGKMEFRLAKEWNIPTLWFIIQPKGVLCDSCFRQRNNNNTWTTMQVCFYHNILNLGYPSSKYRVYSSPDAIPTLISSWLRVGACFPSDCTVMLKMFVGRLTLRKTGSQTSQQIV